MQTNRARQTIKTHLYRYALQQRRRLIRNYTSSTVLEKNAICNGTGCLCDKNFHKERSCFSISSIMITKLDEAYLRIFKTYSQFSNDASFSIQTHFGDSDEEPTNNHRTFTQLKLAPGTWHVCNVHDNHVHQNNTVIGFHLESYYPSKKTEHQTNENANSIADQMEKSRITNRELNRIVCDIHMNHIIDTRNKLSFKLSNCETLNHKSMVVMVDNPNKENHWDNIRHCKGPDESIDRIKFYNLKYNEYLMMPIFPSPFNMYRDMCSLYTILRWGYKINGTTAPDVHHNATYFALLNEDLFMALPDEFVNERDLHKKE